MDKQLRSGLENSMPKPENLKGENDNPPRYARPGWIFALGAVLTAFVLLMIDWLPVYQFSRVCKEIQVIATPGTAWHDVMTQLESKGIPFAKAGGGSVVCIGYRQPVTAKIAYRIAERIDPRLKYPWMHARADTAMLFDITTSGRVEAFEIK